MAREKPAPVAMLDERDRAIVAALADNAWLTFAELGRCAHLSASATQRRVIKLRAQGVIQGAKATIAWSALGAETQIFVLVELTNEASSAIRAFAKHISAEASVTGAHYVAGIADIVISMQVSSMAEYAAFAEKYLNSNNTVRRYRTLTVMTTLL